MAISVAYLGPTGTYSEMAALAYLDWLAKEKELKPRLCSYPTITKVLSSVAQGETQLAVVPVENSIQGSVTQTLDTFWQLDQLQIQQALVVPVAHALLSKSSSPEAIQTVYSHPQALAQCQRWLENHLPKVGLVATDSTTEAVQNVKRNPLSAAIASVRASEIYQIPILATEINDYPENCTRFWAVGTQKTNTGNYVSLAFSVADVPGSLVKPLQVFARRGINLTHIESRPTKRSLGEYLFFVDLEGDMAETRTKDALAELLTYTKELKIFGNYSVLPIFQQTQRFN